MYFGNISSNVTNHQYVSITLKETMLTSSKQKKIQMNIK